MLMRKMRILGFCAALMLAFSPADIYGQRGGGRDRAAEDEERRRLELQRQIERIQAERAREEQRIERELGPIGGTEQSVAQWQDFYDRSCVGDNARGGRQRCSDALFSVAAGTYREERDAFIAAQQKYESDFAIWERGRQQGARPTSPRPNYQRSLRIFQTAVERYAGTPRASEGWLEIGGIYLLDGDAERARAAFDQLVRRYPNDRRASAAHFRIGEICFGELRDFNCALTHFGNINPSHVTPDIVEIAHFRRAEIHHARGDLDEAVRLYTQYVDKCISREFTRCELRPEAIENIAIAFSDMENGAQAAAQFFTRLGARTFEDTVMYRIGMRNFDHGQFEQAIIALNRAIERFPNFVDAPRAQMNIVNSHLVRTRPAEANTARERLIELFSPGTPWIQANSRNSAAMAIARDMVKQALSSIALYYHALAQQASDPQIARGHFERAVAAYERVIRDFSDDVWMVYEFNFNLAEALMAVGRFEDAAVRYNLVAYANLSSFPVFRPTIDTMGMSAAEIERTRAEGAARTSPINISQGDAGWGAIVALDTLRRVQVAQGQLNTQQAYALPITRRLLQTIVEFQQRFPQDPKAAEALYAAASIHFDGSNYAEAIAVSHRILASYGADTTMWRQATKLAADSYTKNEQFDEGIAKYDELIARTRNNPDLLQTYIDLAAAAIFQKATRMRERRQIALAAAEFQTIVVRYPASTVAPLGWFEAAVTYEEADSAAAAARIFREFPTRFPRHELLQRAFVRSGENFAKAGMFVEAGEVMRTGAQTVNQPEFSIGALGVAAGYFRSAGRLETVGDMYFEIFRMFPTDEQAPQALYNSGLAFEEAKNFTRAIEVYSILGTRYVDSEFAPSGYFSIGLAYEQMGDLVKMAEAFVSYARRFTSNRDSQIKALNRAGGAFRDLGRTAEAEENFLLATQIFARFRESDALSNEDGAVAFFNLAEIYRARFQQLTLTGRAQRDVEAASRRKQEAFQQLAETYMNAAGLAIAEWTIRSIHSVGLASKSYAEAVRNQSLFGNNDVQTGARIQILSGTIHEFYDEAIGNFARAVQFAREAGIAASFVSDAETDLTQAWFMKGNSFQEAGTMIRNTAIPAGLDEEEEMAFIDMVEEFYLNFVQQALPVFVNSIDNITALFIGRNEWTDSIQGRIQLLAAELQVAGFSFGELSQGEVDLNAERARAREEGRFVVITAAELARREARQEHNQALAAVSSIVASNMSVNEKLSSLASRRTNAERATAQEAARISELRNRLGLN